MLVLVGWTVGSVWAVTFHRWLLVPLFAAGALGAFGLAYVAELRVRSNRRDRKSELLRAWSGTEISAGLRWFKWLALVGFFGSLTFGAAILMRAADIRPLGIVLFGLFAFALLSFALPGLAAASAGYLLRLDALGIHHCRSPEIAWRDVQALDLQHENNRGHISYFLVVTLQAQASRTWPRPGVLSWIGGPRLRRKTGQVVFPLPLAAIDPDLLLHAARTIAGRAGVPIGQGWPWATGRAASTPKDQHATT